MRDQCTCAVVHAGCGARLAEQCHWLSAIFCLFRRNMSRQLPGRSCAKMPFAYLQTCRIKNQYSSNTQIDRKHRANRALLLLKLPGQ